jgi:hypothetical protein
VGVEQSSDRRLIDVADTLQTQLALLALRVLLRDRVRRTVQADLQCD